MSLRFDINSITPSTGGGGSGGETIITAENLTGSAISAGDKVWIQEENNEYKLLKFSKKEFQNFTIVGNLTVNDKVFSGFSSSNYVSMSSYPIDITSYEMLFKFKLNTTTGYWQTILGQSANNKATPQIAVDESGKLAATHPVDASTWATNLVYDTSLTYNKWYWVRFSWNGTQMKLEVSEDGETWITASTINETRVYWNEACRIGIDINESELKGYIDLSESYMKVNGEMWWQPYQDVSNITQDVITGIAKENIAISGTGDIAVGMVEATGTISITENGTYNVTNYASADVSVAGGSSAIQTIFSGEIDEYGIYTPAFMLEYEGDVSFDGIKTIDTSAYAANEAGTFASYFYHELSSTGKGRLKTRLIKGKISFPDLETINDTSCFSSFCIGQTKITELSFDKLERVSGNNTNSEFSYFCADASSLRIVRFPKLSYIGPTAKFNIAFRNTSTLDIYFNGLTTTSFPTGTLGKTQFNNMMSLSGTTGIHTIHFPSNLESTIQDLTGYPLFGGTDGYVVLAFDLPATE